nr:hypothetical protein [Tanacetum cinerariifolium]
MQDSGGGWASVRVEMVADGSDGCCGRQRWLLWMAAGVVVLTVGDRRSPGKWRRVEDDDDDPEEDPSEEHEPEDDDEDPEEDLNEEHESKGSDETEPFKEDKIAVTPPPS